MRVCVSYFTPYFTPERQASCGGRGGADRGGCGGAGVVCFGPGGCCGMVAVLLMEGDGDG